MRRRDNAYVHRQLGPSTDPANRSFLQEAQQSRLQIEREVADLVEKQRSTGGALDESALALCGTGERAALVAEELRLDEIRRQRCAVDCNERAVAPLAVVVNRARGELLARPGFAHQQCRQINRRDSADLAKHSTHRRAGAE